MELGRRRGGKVFWHKNSGARLCSRRGAIHYEPKEEEEEEEEGKTLPPPFFPAKREAKEEDCTVVCWRLFWSVHEPTQAFTTFFSCTKMIRKSFSIFLQSQIEFFILDRM